MFRRKVVILGFLAAAGTALAADKSDKGGGSTNLAPYKFEIVPTLGVNLPYELDGTSGAPRLYGVRVAYNIAQIYGDVMASYFYQDIDTGHAHTFELAYRYDFVQSGLNAFTTIGMHESFYSLGTNFQDGHVGDANYCIPSDCSTDSGSHLGFMLGGGFELPVIPRVPFVVGVRFYTNPHIWLLLDLGVGLRI